MEIYVVRVATRTVNGDGCHEAISLKGPHHTSSTDRRHYRFEKQLQGSHRIIAETILNEEIFIQIGFSRIQIRLA